MVNAEFHVKHALADLYFDFRGDKVVALFVNGKSLNVDWNGLFIRVPKEELNTAGKNVVNIAFNQNYAKDGQGLHGYIDADGKQYLYSQCESYFTNRLY